jgi:hypothetical protein
LAAVVAVVEGNGQRWDVAQAAIDQTQAGAKAPHPDTACVRAAKAVAARLRKGDPAAVLAAVGHPQRLRILVKLLEGPATYRSLQKVTGLKAGPLYHHVSQLRMATLIGPRQRDLYELTRAGRNVTLVALLIGSLARDGRGRPTPKT